MYIHNTNNVQKTCPAGTPKNHRCWGHVDPVCPVGNVQCCRGCFAVPGPLQSVQRAEMWGVILALQSSGAVHLGVDNLGVVRHVGCLLDGRPGSIPFELLKDGDFLLLIDRMLRLRGLSLIVLMMLLRVPVTWLRLLLDDTLQVWLLSGVPLMSLMRLGLLLLCRITPMSGRMVALSLIGSLVSLRAGFFAHHSENCFSGLRWGHVDGVRPGGEVWSCSGFCSAPGPLQSVQRAEMWGVMLALQSSGAVHLGVDNLGVVRHGGRLLDGHHGSVPFELVKDGDLLLLIESMLQLRSLDTVRMAADEVADFGRRRVGNAVIDARRNLSGVCNRWYPVLLDLHRFFIAISRAVVNHDGSDGTAPDPSVWSAGALPKRRRLVHAVRDRAFLLGPPALWDSDWVVIPASAISDADLAQWPCTPGLLVKWVSFLASLHWLAGGSDLGVGGISYLELLILYELWAGERLSLEKTTPLYLRPGRPISVSAVPFGPGIDIWRSCSFFGALMRSLCLLPGGLGRFVACSIGANHCRLRHIGWEKCSHGLTSRPRESASLHFLDELLALFRYPAGSGRASLAGTLPLRYCAARFACLTLSWRLPVHGSVGDLVAAYSDAGRRAAVAEVGRDVYWVSGSGSGRKRIRLNRKTPAHLAVYVTHSRPRVWKRLRHGVLLQVSDSDHKRRRCEDYLDGCIPFHERTGVG